MQKELLFSLPDLWSKKCKHPEFGIDDVLKLDTGRIMAFELGRVYDRHRKLLDVPCKGFLFWGPTGAQKKNKWWWQCGVAQKAYAIKFGEEWREVLVGN